jgi:stress-induced morphogen
MTMDKTTTTINNIDLIKDDDVYIIHESPSFKFTISKKAFNGLSKREQKKLVKLASHNFVIERK